MPDNDRMLIIGFHPEDMRLILARNNPDHARSTIVLVPGTGPETRAMDRHKDEAEVLFDKLAAHPDDDALSVITWADYVAPETAEQARDSSFAVPAAPRLASFLAGLRVTSEYKKAARIVVIARGYGGLVAGLTARDHGLDADALVFLGCAAAGVERASDLRFDGPVYASPSDSGGDNTPLGVHGPRPDSPAFGAERLRSGPLSFRSDPFVRYLPSLRRIIFNQA